jgi:hypothetical protein
MELVLPRSSASQRTHGGHDQPDVAAGGGGQGRQSRQRTTPYLTLLHGCAVVLKRLIANIGAALR